MNPKTRIEERRSLRNISNCENKSKLNLRTQTNDMKSVKRKTKAK